MQRRSRQLNATAMQCKVLRPTPVPSRLLSEQKQSRNPKALPYDTISPEKVNSLVPVLGLLRHLIIPFLVRTQINSPDSLHGPNDVACL
jgi:hypothetical protein